MKLDVIAVPGMLSRDSWEGCLCAVVDVLRATSTIVVALAEGAAKVHPCLNAEEARRCAEPLGRERYLLGGEERGQRIAGFDLGNSPLEYLAPEVVKGKTIFLSTTNGTAAIRAAYEASGLPVCVAALLNVSAVSSLLASAIAGGEVTEAAIVCSGRQGGLSAEDLFCAGLIVELVSRGLCEAGIPLELGDGACVAAGFAAGDGARAMEVLLGSEHGRYLESIGFAADIAFAARLDVYDAIPIFDGERIVLL